MMSDYKVEMIDDGLSEFNVEFNGPKESIPHSHAPTFILMYFKLLQWIMMVPKYCI